MRAVWIRSIDAWRVISSCVPIQSQSNTHKTQNNRSDLPNNSRVTVAHTNQLVVVFPLFIILEFFGYMESLMAVVCSISSSFKKKNNNKQKKQLTIDLFLHDIFYFLYFQNSIKSTNGKWNKKWKWTTGSGRYSEFPTEGLVVNSLGATLMALAILMPVVMLTRCRRRGPSSISSHSSGDRDEESERL